MAGTVNISRGIWDDTAFKNQPFTQREAFIWLVMEASWKARDRRVGNVVVSLERGQLACSVRFMAEAWQWQKSTVHRFLEVLKKRDMIGTASGTGILIVTVCNYDEYQNGPSQHGTPKKTKAGQQRDSSGTNENKGLIKGVIQKDDCPPDFEEFWSAYPHRGGVKRKRSDAEKKFSKIVSDGVDPKIILQGVERSKSDPSVQGGYARDPVTWLNQKGWQDEVSAHAKPNSERSRWQKLAG